MGLLDKQGIGMKRWARFSPCGRYRYELGRDWNRNLPRVLFIGVNPSTADAYKDDLTVKKWIGFCKLWGCGSFVALNLFAYKATKIVDLHKAEEPIGVVENELTLASYIESGLESTLVCCWGDEGTWLKRDSQFLEKYNHHTLYCLGRTKAGNPRHPSRLAYATPLEIYYQGLV